MSLRYLSSTATILSYFFHVRQTHVFQQRSPVSTLVLDTFTLSRLVVLCHWLQRHVRCAKYVLVNISSKSPHDLTSKTHLSQEIEAVLQVVLILRKFDLAISSFDNRLVALSCLASRKGGELGPDGHQAMHLVKHVNAAVKLVALVVSPF